jgi:transportin-1
VQEAGASAFANLEEKAGKVLQPYCGPIIQQFVRCFAKYKDRNMYILYDCVQTLAERLGSDLANPDLTNQLMPALIDRYNNIPDQSRELFPLLECLSYVALALGDAFTPFAAPIFVRCVNIIHNNLEQSLNATSNPTTEQPEKDFLITSLDLLSAIIQALEGAKAGELIKASPHSFFELLSFCMEDPSDDVRQSAYALLGDCARFVFPQLQPYLQTIFPILLKQLDLDNILDEEMDSGFGVVNNSCWSAGEIALQNGSALSQFVDELLQRFVEIMSNPRVPKGLSENAAIALGRLGIDNAPRLASDLSKYADEFLAAMDDVEWNEEKATAFKGFTTIVGQNPEAMGDFLLKFFTVIARYRDTTLRSPLKEEVHNNFQQVLTHYKGIMPSFDSFVGSLPAKDQQALRSNYSI